jgi:hypothetical protein
MEPHSVKRRKAKGSSAVSELDLIPQAVTKHGYPEGAYLLNSKIYTGVRISLSCALVRFTDLESFCSMRRLFVRRCASGARSMVTLVVGMWEKHVDGVFGIGRLVSRLRVSPIFPVSIALRLIRKLLSCFQSRRGGPRRRQTRTGKRRKRQERQRS